MSIDAILGARRGERLAVLAFSAAFLGLLVAMPGWRAGEANQGYAMTPQTFTAWQADFAARYAADGVVRPPPGDVPMLASRYTFAPALVLRVGQTYRLNLESADAVHSLWLDGIEVLVVPGRVTVLTVTPTAPGALEVRCGEYCGLGHNRMRASIVVEP